MTVFWNLSQAIVWIATHDEDAVAAAPDKVLILRLTDTNSGSIADAQQKLWDALQVGCFQATGIGNNRERCVIPSECWHDLRPYLLGNTETLQRKGLHPGTAYTEVIVASAAVRNEWPAGGHGASVEFPQPAKAKNIADEVAELIRKRWPGGQPLGMKVKDFENAIVALVKAETGSNISTRTAKRARARAKR
jgi:hypothetical protein